MTKFMGAPGLQALGVLHKLLKKKIGNHLRGMRSLVDTFHGDDREAMRNPLLDGMEARMCLAWSPKVYGVSPLLLAASHGAYSAVNFLKNIGGAKAAMAEIESNPSLLESGGKCVRVIGLGARG